MPFCLNCGREIPPGAKFCGNCGAPVQSADQYPGKASGTESSTSPATNTDRKPEGLRLLITLSFVASICMIAFGVLLVLIAPLAPKTSGLGVTFILIGIGTFVPRYGFSNAKSWGRSAGYVLGVVYTVLGLLFIPGSILIGALSLLFGVATLYYMTRPAAKTYFKK